MKYLNLFTEKLNTNEPKIGDYVIIVTDTVFQPGGYARLANVLKILKSIKHSHGEH